MLTLMEDDRKASTARYSKNKNFGLGVEGDAQYPSSFYHTPPNHGDEQFLNEDPLLSSTNDFFNSEFDVPPKTVPTPKVESTLDNPTPYHLKEKQRRQIQQYMSSQQPSNNAPSSSMLSPNRLSPKSMTPDTPLSPDDMNMNFGNFEIDSIFERITLPSNEKPEQDSQMNIEIPINSLPSSYTYSNTVPHQPVFTYYPESPGTPNFSMMPNMTSQQHMSCPAHLGIHKPESTFSDEMKQYTKERQKKDNHNAIERRRRFNINDRIKELGTLLPKQDPEIRPNKGTILKSSVDYIESLQSDQMLWNKQRDAMSARIAHLENCLRKHGISESEWGPSIDIDLFSHHTYPVKIKQEPETSFFAE